MRGGLCGAVAALGMMVSATMSSAATLGSFMTADQINALTSREISAFCKKAPDIQTEFSYLEPVFQNTRPAGSERQRNEELLMGLAYIGYGYDVTFLFERIGSSAGICIRVADIHIASGTEPPIVYLNPEIEPGSCEHRVTITHELEHVQNYYDHLERFEMSLKRELGYLLQGETSIEVSSEDEVDRIEATIKNRISEAVKTLHTRSHELSRKKDAAMDTYGEYVRLSNLCDGA